MYYLYIRHDQQDIQYIGSYDDAHDALDHGHSLLEGGDGYWPDCDSVMVSKLLNLETD